MKEHSDTVEQRLENRRPGGKVGIVTVTYNSGAVLADFLESLSQQDHKNFIVFAVDNASTDDTIIQLRAWNESRLQIIANEENHGIARGNNQGIRAALAAGCDYVLLLNNDVVFRADLIGKLVRGLDEHACQMTAPIIYYNDQPDVVWSAGGVFESGFGYRSMHIGDGEKDHGQFSEARSVSFAPACCLMVRHEVFARIGLMDERYFVYSDDTDFMYRAWRARLPLYLLPQVKLWHKVSSLTGGNQSEFTQYYGSRGRVLFLTKHLGKFRGALWTVAYSIGYPLRSLFGKDSLRQAIIRVRGVLDGYKAGCAGHRV